MIGAFTTRWTRFLILVLTACASNTGRTSAPPTWMGLTVQPEGPPEPVNASETLLEIN